jgi:anti-sigma factor ChrR (cupin superfamily)
MKPFSRHLTFEALVEIAEGQMASGPGDGDQVHLQTCSQCRTTLNDLVHMMAALRSDELQAPPANVTERAVQVFRPAKRPVSPLASGLRLWHA